MLNPEKESEFKDTEEIKKIAEEEIKKIILEVEEVVIPLYEKIERLRKENPHREVGGHIRNGKIELLDESRWRKHSVIGEKIEKEREMAKEGILSFHTHPDSGSTSPSGQDILAVYFCLKELIFHKDGVTLLIALKELPIEQIRKINEQAWQEAQEEEEKWGDPAYWFWYGKLQEKLPVFIVDLINKDKSKLGE